MRQPKSSGHIVAKNTRHLATVRNRVHIKFGYHPIGSSEQLMWCLTLLLNPDRPGTTRLLKHFLVSYLQELLFLLLIVCAAQEFSYIEIIEIFPERREA